MQQQEFKDEESVSICFSYRDFGESLTVVELYGTKIFKHQLDKVFDTKIQP